ncbi:MAG: LacI family DNA-binding transcriptional regulator [Bacteroidales bacterium]|nr:LacI family DNA-binding transcriptional regulator [Bacteroidales bacterium]
MTNKKITLTDIARELGVSKTLVSLVLNGKGNANAINKDTQKKVLQKAQELNYKPNQVARGLRMGITNTIGLLVADISNPFYARIARIIEHHADIEGYSLIVCSSDEDEERELKLIRMLTNRQVDGIIMASTLQDPATIEQLINQKFPIVLFDRYFKNLDCNYVGVDNTDAALQAVSLLIRKGHRNIGFLTLTPDYISSLQDRKQGYTMALENAGISQQEKLILELDYRDVKKKHYNQIKEFIIKNNEISAIFTTNNSLAVGCIDAIKELGLQIPEDISLITFDDVELFKYISPALSSIAQPVEDIGKTAVSILLNQLKSGEAQCIKQELQANLIIRES